MVLGNLHEVVGGVLRAREARERGGIAGESGSLLLQRQSAVVPVSPGGRRVQTLASRYFIGYLRLTSREIIILESSTLIMYMLIVKLILMFVFFMIVMRGMMSILE